MDLSCLKLYVIKSHADKELSEDFKDKAFEIPLQAGAALTDKRITLLNDYDGFDESISKYNNRYSEVSAIYWIGKHIDSRYVGAEHYRRRLDLDEKTLSSLIEADTDIITTVPSKLDCSIKMDYINNHYGGDFAMMMELLKKYDEENFSFYLSECEKDHLHYGNINIMKGELFLEYCDFIFSVLEEMRETIPLRTDTYNGRDLGFVAERLSHLFVMKKKQEGKKVFLCPVKQVYKKPWYPSDECDLKNPDQVYLTIERLYAAHEITKCCQVLGAANEYGGEKDERLRELSTLFLLGINERMQGTTSLHDYLPVEMRCDLKTLLYTFRQLKEILSLYGKTPTNEMKALLESYLNLTGFTALAINAAKESI